MPSITTDVIFLDESNDNLNFPSSSALQCVDDNDQQLEDQISVSDVSRSTPKKRMLEKYFVEVAETGNLDPNITESPQPFIQLLGNFERHLSKGVTKVPYGPQHFQFILEVVNKKDKPSIVHFIGNMEMKEKYSTNFSDFDQDKNLSYWAEQRKHFTLGNHIGIKVLSYKNRKVTLRDVLKPHKSDEFTCLSAVPWKDLGDKPSPFDDSFYDPTESILSIDRYFGQYFGITDATTEVSPAGSMLPMHTEEHFAQTINFNHGPGVKLWVVIKSKFTLKAGEILEKHKFKNFYGVCCWTFCHRDVVFNLERENIPFEEILQHPGDTVFLPPGTLHMVTNISANMSESLNIIMRKDLPICRSYKVCQTHQDLVQISGKEEMNNLYEKFKTNKIDNFIYFADDQRDRKLRAIEQLKNSGDPEKEELLSNLEHSYEVSHEVPEILEAYEEGRFLFQDTRACVGPSRDVASEPERDLIEIHHRTLQNAEDGIPENVDNILNSEEFGYPTNPSVTGSALNCETEREQNLTVNQYWAPPNAEESGSSLEHAFARTTVMVHQPDSFVSVVEEIGNTPTQGYAGSSTDWGTEQDQTELENDLEPAGYDDDEAEAEDSDVDEDEFRIIVVGQNILKSGTQKFKCLCPCQPTVTSKNYNKCFQHLQKKHQMRIIIPIERCTLCGIQNKSVFKNIHTCAVTPRPRKNMKWRQSASYNKN